MPFSLDETPERLQGKNIPRHFIRLFINVWNSVWERTHDEGAAYRQAHGVLRRALEKAGYHEDKNGVWHKAEGKEAEMELLEGWLPAGISQNDLDDGDFAWLSDEYKSGKSKNKAAGRKLPFKIHGKVNRDGWKAAWKAAAWHSAREPDWGGGPSKEATLALLRRYKPSGITINKDNTFTDTEGGTPESVVLSATNTGFKVIEEAEDGLRFKGVALIDEAISANGNYYSRAFNDKCMQATNAYMESGGTVTIYSRHGKALPARGELPRDLPIGKVSVPLFRENGEIWYQGFIAPTTEGKDVITLVRTGVMAATSIRATNFKSRTRKMGGQVVEELLEAVIAGIDLTDDAGIQGAGIKEILEEVPQWEEEEMDWTQVTLEDLISNCKALLDEYAASIVEAAQAGMESEKVTELETTLAEKDKALAEVTEQANAAVEKVGALEENTKKLTLDLKVAEAAHVGVMAKYIAEELRGQVACEEDIGKLLPEVKQRALALVLNEGITGTAKGRSSFSEDGEGSQTDEGPELTEEAKKVLSLAQ